MAGESDLSVRVGEIVYRKQSLSFLFWRFGRFVNFFACVDKFLVRNMHHASGHDDITWQSMMTNVLFLWTESSFCVVDIQFQKGACIRSKVWLL